MVVLSCAYSAYPTHAVSLRAHRGFSPERSTSPVSVSLTHHHRRHHRDHPFVPEAMDTKDAGEREALDQAFAEIVGAESAIVRSQAPMISDVHCLLFLISHLTIRLLNHSLSLNQRRGFSRSRRSEDLLRLLKIVHMLSNSKQQWPAAAVSDCGIHPPKKKSD
ncbi:unnamed protein product [Camellia sinensis]